ncbi:uncharacterized protein LOC117782924 [Drosophila innubila]|uniref:uncharacterized protein LOC117782924 n=1 Tax=Drosophila innubila TaxID=198719 RepID=UPI00148C4359|nr:uncharacterized protein LOC117782924 [Drosophila innubila]
MVILAVLYQRCIEIGASFYNCEFLIETGPPLELVCSGYYSLELKLRYRDNLVDPAAPYRIWARSYSNSTRQIFISFYESPITHCNNITCHLNWLHCDKSGMFGIIVHPEEIHCFRYTFSYVKDLQRNCNALVDDAADYVGIHYANLFDLNTNSTSTVKQEKILSILVLIWSLKHLQSLLRWFVLQMSLNSSIFNRRDKF